MDTFFFGLKLCSVSQVEALYQSSLDVDTVRNVRIVDSRR